MKQKYILALATILPLAATLSTNTTAQTQEHHHKLPLTERDGSNNYETLSGINLYATGKGTYQLDFSQKLKENAMLSISNTARKVVFKKPVSVQKNNASWRYNVGKLKPGTYLVEVITSDTTYWTKFKIGR